MALILPMLSTRLETRRRVAARSSVMPLSSSFVCAIAPCRLACDVLSCAMSCFWSAIRRASARCWAWASASSSAWTAPGRDRGRGEHADEEGDRQEGDEEAGPAVSARPRETLGCRVAGQRAGVLISCERFVSGAAARGNGRGTDHARRIWHRLRGHSRDDRFPASGQCTSVGNPFPSVAPARCADRRLRPPPSSAGQARSVHLAARPSRQARSGHLAARPSVQPSLERRAGPGIAPGYAFVIRIRSGSLPAAMRIAYLVRA